MFRASLPHRYPENVLVHRIQGHVIRFDFRQIRRILDFDDRFLDFDKNILGASALGTGKQAVVRGSEGRSGGNSRFGKARTGIVKILADGTDGF